MDTDSTTKSWCLVRWHKGYTSAKLRARGKPGVGLNVDPQTGAAFGGPLALLYEEQRAQHMRAGRFGMLGFPEPRGSLGFPKLLLLPLLAHGHTELYDDAATTLVAAEARL